MNWRKIRCLILWFRHRPVQTRGGWFCDRCDEPHMPKGW